MSGHTVCELRRVRVRYGSRLAADEVSLRLDEGQVYALLGRNGAGKSSLVRCLLGQQRPSAGEALLFGEDAWLSRARAMARVGVVPETPDAPPDMTVRQIEALLARLTPGWSRDLVVARLERFGIPRTTPFGRLSKGEKAQAMLAFALGHSPKLLVLDDPTLGLDAVARRELFEELIGVLADHGTSILMTTHDLTGVETIADRIGILHDGRLVVDEPLEALKARHRRLRLPRVVEALPSGAVAVRGRSLGTEVIVADWPPDRDDADSEGMTLEEIFLAVVGEDRDGGGR